MYLHKVHLDFRNKEARRDLSDPYQMHATLCRIFSPPDQKCPEGEFLWRLEPDINSPEGPKLLIQSRSNPDWSRIGVRGWMMGEPSPCLDLAKSKRLNFENLKNGDRFRFRLRANPCVTRQGKRFGLFKQPEQEAWLARKGVLNGFEVETMMISETKMMVGHKHQGREIRIFSALFDGSLTVVDPILFSHGLRQGIGHGKSMGLGLLSVVRL